MVVTGKEHVEKCDECSEYFCCLCGESYVCDECGNIFCKDCSGLLKCTDSFLSLCCDCRKENPNEKKGEI